MKTYAFPGMIEEDILDIAARQIPYMRTEWFSTLMKENERMLLKAIGCRGGKVLFYTSSGTGAMEAVVTNYVACFEKAFVIDGGSFGHRWAELCDYHGIGYVDFTVPFAHGLDYSLLEESVASSGADVLLCQHHETSSGQLFDLSRISGICRRHGLRLVVDVISSFLSDHLDMDGMGIDIAVASSQKGLNIPPGAAFVFLSQAALDTDFAHGGYYFDFKTGLSNIARGQTPFSPATTIFMQLHERLERIEREGVEKLMESARAKAEYFRRLCKKHGWMIPAENPSNAMTGFFVDRNADKIFAELQKMDIYVMPSGRPGFFRVSHTGLQSREDLDELAEAISKIENF